MFYLIADVTISAGNIKRGVELTRCETLATARALAERYKARSGDNVTVQERRDVYTTSTLEEAIQGKARTIVNTPDTHTPDTLALYAKNVGAFYPTLCDMARKRVSGAFMRTYLIETIIPCFTRETGERVTMGLDALNATAEMLRDYYVQHVNEG